MEIKKTYCFILILLVVEIAGNGALYGQKNQLIKGVLKDQTSKQSIAFATVSLYNSSDSTFIIGTISNTDGEYYLTTGFTGKAFLKINFLGYKTFLMNINVMININLDAGIIYLEEEYYNIKETVIQGNRIKAHDEADKTRYFVDKKIHDVSNTGIDVLKHITGVQVDLMQNVSLEGSTNILFLVDGIERDKNFIQQLSSDKIDKVEIMPIPASKYDADVTGIINIMLKKEKSVGIDGQIYTDIPVRKSEIYSFPKYSLNFNYKKLNVFTSCNGDIRYFDMTEGYKRKLVNNEELTDVEQTNSYRQKNWSYRFHFGFDYFINDKNLINFYSFYNPAKYSDAGNMRLQSWNSVDLVEERTSFKKNVEDIDMSYYSLYYKHLFRKPAREISCDINFFNFQSDKTLSYENNMVSGNYINDNITKTKPTQSNVRAKIDFTTPLNDKLKLDAGMKTNYTLRENKVMSGFMHKEEIFAFYTSVNYHASKWNVNVGLRTEKSFSGIGGDTTNEIMEFMPYSAISYSITPKQKVKLSYRRQIKRPMLNQLDSYKYTNDPFNTFTGNSGLKPEMHDNLYLDYSMRFGNQYLSHRLFYTHISDAINNLSFLNDTVMETEVHNMGYFNLYGYQLTGSLSPFKAFTVNSNVKLFAIQTLPGEMALNHAIEKKTKMVFELGLSAIMAFKYDINASFFLNYSSTMFDIQHNIKKDPLYFIMIQKSFNKKLKIGVAAYLPFLKTFNDREVYTSTTDVLNRTVRNIHLSSVPLMFNIGYQFNSGKTTKKINRNNDLIEPVEREGF